MCGIAGFFSTTSSVDDLTLQKMGDAIAHRGPDDAGVYRSEDGQVGLSFRRLSIIDVSSAGHQPMRDAAGEAWIVFNGEVYNFLSLRKELEQAGRRFMSRTDSEVVLNAYLEWGEKCVTRLAGMFAFAIWVPHNKTLFLARDRIGIKPLFYYYDGTRLVFSSEIKSILTVPGIAMKIDETAIYDFLTYLYIPTPKTLYQNMFKLPAAHHMTVSNGKVRIAEYWDIDLSRKVDISETEASKEIRRLLENSVQSHLMSDVPLGVFLSGGIDSSVVASLAQRFHDSPLKSFSIGFDVEEYSELPFAKSMSDFCGTIYHQETIDRHLFSNASEFLMKLYDEPFGDSSAAPTYFVSQLARKEVTVALSGDGGDEVFGGYNWYSTWLKQQSFNKVHSTLYAVMARLYPKSWRGYERIAGKSKREIPLYGFLMGGIVDEQKRRLLDERFLTRFSDYDPWWYFRKYWHEELDPLTRMQYLDFKTYLPDDILVKVDRASMAVSLEVRVPLLDYPLVEFVFSLPVNIRNRDGVKKYLFKKAVHDLLPSNILNRSKKGFSIPANHWMPTKSFSKATTSIFNERIVRRPDRWVKGNKSWQIHVMAHYLNSVVQA